MNFLHPRIILKLLYTLIMIAVFFLPVVSLWLAGEQRVRARLVQFFFKAMLVGLRIHVQVHGQASHERPLIVVSNHMSYVDVFILGSLMPLSFTPKNEVRGWPVIGFFCQLADCFFIDRNPRKAKEMSAMLRDGITNARVLCIFPEATTSDGLRILPFKSSLLSIAETTHDGAEVAVQPVALAYTHLSNMPIDSGNRTQIAWVGEAEFAPHVLHFLTLGKLNAKVTFLPTVTAGAFASRKLLAASLEHSISESHAEMLRLQVQKRK